MARKRSSSRSSAAPHPAGRSAARRTGRRTPEAERELRLAGVGVRMNEQVSTPALHRFLIDEAAKGSGAQRVLVVLDGAAGLQLAGAQLPAGEHAAALLRAITPWLEEARRRRAVSLRHGPEGAAAIDQRSCVIAPLIAQHELLGFLYADIEGVVGRFDETERDALALLASQAAVALANRRAADGLAEQLAERNARLAQRDDELALINRVQEGIAAELSYQAIIDLVGDKLRALFATGNLSISSVDEAAGKLHVLYAYEHGVRLQQQSFDLSEVAAGRRWFKAAKARQAVVWTSRDEYQAWELFVVPGTDMSRSGVAIPIFAGERLSGFIVLENHERDAAYGEADVRLLSTVASSTGVALENARLFDETQQTLEQQRAAAEVLSVISSSVADAAPVFERILTSCGRLFGGLDTGINLVGDEGAIHLGAYAGPNRKNFETIFPLPLTSESGSGSAILARRVMHYPDVEGDPDVPEYVRRGCRLTGIRSIIFAPMLWEGRGIGSIFVGRDVVQPFSDKEVALLRTFAEQAVIAIQNARLFNETKEALARQTATAEILKVISESPTDVTPVFDAIAERARLLCGASFGATTRFDGELVHMVGYRGTSLQAEADMRAVFPRKLAPGFINGRCILARAPVQITDFLLDEQYKLGAAAKAGEWRSALAVPMLLGGQAIGAITVGRREPGAFADDLIALLETFADQAVIAIQNARLFNETKEALARQTATAEILKVISESPTDVQPVMDAVAQRAGEICRAEGSRVWLMAEGKLRAMTSYGPGYWSDEQVEVLPQRSTSVAGRAVLERRCVHVEDVLPVIDSEYPDIRELQARYGFRTVLAVPLLRAGEPEGVIALLRNEVRPFSPVEIGLVQTFADQAVIAIHNVRLFNETKEALERQTATAEILKVIARSPADVQPVLDAIVESARQLVGGFSATVQRVVGDTVHLAAYTATDVAGAEALKGFFPEADHRRLHVRADARDRADPGRGHRNRRADLARPCANWRAGAAIAAQ